MLKFLLTYTGLISCLVVLAQSAPKGSVEDQPTGVQAAGKTWSVIVGISSYQNITKLNYADKDALAFYDYLKSDPNNIPASQIKVLLNSEALASEIYGALEWLAGNVKENDRVVFYYSGHGDVENKTIHQNGFLLAYDSPSAAYMTKGTISIKFLQDYLETYIALNKAKEVVLIVDACRSGKLAGGLQGIQITMQALGKNWNNHIIKILSAQEGELSYEDKKWGGGRGVFSYYLMKGIKGLANRNGDSTITTAELAMYLPVQVADATENNQNPKIEGNSKEVLFTFNKALLKEATQAEKATDGRTSVQTASKGKTKQLDTLSKKWYDLYAAHLKTGRLLWGKDKNDSVNCAVYYYNQLMKSKDGPSLHASLRSSLFSNLQNKTQQYLDNYLKGESYRGFTKNTEALKEIQHALSLIDSSHILYKYVRSRMLFLQSAFSKDHHKAIALLKEAEALEEDAPYVHNRLGARYSDLKLYDSAVYYYQKAIALSPSWSYPYTNMGIVYRELQDFPKAIDYYKKALSLNKNSALTYYNLGLTYRHMSDYAKAIENYQQAIQLEPTDPKLYNNTGVAYSKMGNYKKALEYYSQAVRVDSNYYFGYFNMACSYSMLQEKEAALKHLEEALNKGYKSKANIEKEKSLEFIRSSPEFQDLLIRFFTQKNAAPADVDALGNKPE